MTHTYKVSGMTCSGCQAKVQGLLSAVPGVKAVTINLPGGEARIEMERHIATQELASALKDHPKYQLSGMQPDHTETATREDEQKNWLETYKPILLIFAYILGITLLTEYIGGDFSWQRGMSHFMAGFFLAFSFFKLLNLKGFAESYAMYDVVARRWNGWGYVYAFVELALGIAYLTGFHAVLINAITFVVMTVSITGVLQSVMNKRKIRCACLGAVFNLPMSTVTIIEDLLMICMSGGMLAWML